MNPPVTVDDGLRFLAPQLADSNLPPAWPPDAFAIAAWLLEKSGAYTNVIVRWPPPKPRGREGSWQDGIRAVGAGWRRHCSVGSPPPREVRNWWTTLREHRRLPLPDVAKRPAVWRTLLQLCAAADEASAGIGLYSLRAPYDPFEFQAMATLFDSQGTTCCQSVHPSRIRVLPKMHTPQSGLTIRSLSHNLALCPSGQVQAAWRPFPAGRETHSMNLLILPWPESLHPAEFRPVPAPLRNLPGRHGFFGCSPAWWSQSIARRLRDVLAQAEKVVGHIHGVVLPEFALSSRQCDEASRIVCRRGGFLVSGVGEPAAPAAASSLAKNYVRFDIPAKVHGRYASLRQAKHHRWKLDRSQVIQYGLGGNLDPDRYWWEAITLEPRTLNFVAMHPWLSVAVLICEDLARQDPAAELVRAVGPNLVLALLMDAPQLPSRWPARYATVLADDPGSSVLTLTSLGMAALSRPPNVPLRPRLIALWKDAKSAAPVEIELPPGAAGCVLSLTVQWDEEWTADGRGDNRTTGYVILAGTHPIFPAL
jgi:hypothetical protein